jgi:hypothetical protein
MQLVNRNFSSSLIAVLQECATDSEELIYQAPSVCSAPPDLLIGSNQQPQQTVTAAMTQSVAVPETPLQPKPAKVVKVKEHQKEKMSQEALERLQKRHSIATTRHLEALEERDRVQLDEFTCDVSVEPTAKKPQPIQFSFTLYDLDGHGKITKDDIAGIVSTIYDSLGKRVVVPHYGKKTINVKLTVSPDGKHQQLQPTTNEHIHHSRASKKLQLTPRRRYRTRALLSDDEDDDASESASDNLAPLPKLQNELHHSTKPSENLNNDKNNVYESINNLKCCNQSQTIDNLLSTKNNKNIEIYKNCQPERLHIDENEEYVVKCHQKLQPSSKKKLLKKSRSRRQRVSEPVIPPLTRDSTFA